MGNDHQATATVAKIKIDHPERSRALPGTDIAGPAPGRRNASRNFPCAQSFRVPAWQ